MQIGIILICLAFPLLELAVLIKVGQSIGFWWTVLLLAGSAVAGGLIIQQQGVTALQRSIESARAGRPPLEPAVDSAFLMLAGMLFLIPGLLTDAAGFLLLIPPLRRQFARWLMARMLSGAGVHAPPSRSEEHASHEGAPRRPGGRSGGEGIVIEGEWERVDEPTKPNPRPSGDKS